MHNEDSNISVCQNAWMSLGPWFSAVSPPPAALGCPYVYWNAIIGYAVQGGGGKGNTPEACLHQIITPARQGSWLQGILYTYRNEECNFSILISNYLDLFSICPPAILTHLETPSINARSGGRGGDGEAGTCKTVLYILPHWWCKIGSTGMQGLLICGGI